MALMAALRDGTAITMPVSDAEFERRAHALVYHAIDPGSDVTRCGRLAAREAEGRVKADRVPPIERCQRPGCKQAWTSAHAALSTDQGATDANE
jgi:hypothetical protein